MRAREVSVIIPSYDRACFLAECLESILGQTLPPRQIIVIDDGSPDDTLLVLGHYKNEIECIQTQNVGKPVALNVAMARVTGEYVWIFDDDDVALPDALERFVRALDQRPDCGFAYSTFYMSRTRVEDGRIEAESEWRLPEMKEEDFLTRLMESNFLCGAGLFARTSCYREVGPFREDLIRSQDYEMALRLSRKYCGIKVEGPTFHYRQHDGMRGNSSDRFPAQRRVEKWLEYDRKFFRDLRREIPLHEYLPRGAAHNDRSPVDTRRAYLQRMTIMASKRLYEEMIEDLGLALAAQVSSHPISEPERKLVSRALSYPPDGNEIFAGSNVLRRVRGLCRSHAVGREVLFEFSRRIYWRACHAWQRRSFLLAFQFLLACIRVGGYSTVIAGLTHRLRAARDLRT